MLIIKIICIALFIFAFVQLFVDKIRTWLKKHQGVMTIFSLTLIITFTISFYDIIKQL